jgi:hypothetical protein
MPYLFCRNNVFLDVLSTAQDWIISLYEAKDNLQKLEIHVGAKPSSSSRRGVIPAKKHNFHEYGPSAVWR